MKITRNQAAYIGVAIILVLLAGLSYFAPERDEQIKLTSSYPATVCPAIGNKVSSIAALTSSKIDRRLIDGVSKRLNPGKGNVIPLKNASLLVEGNPGTSLTFANNGWKSVVPCSVSNGEQWFVGGSGGLTSKSFLYIVNSGFSESAVDLELFTLNGPIESKLVTVPQNSTKKIAIDSLVQVKNPLLWLLRLDLDELVLIYLMNEKKDSKPLELISSHQSGKLVSRW